MTNDKKETPRSFRVKDEIWERFKEACDAQYTNRTEKLNEFIINYIHKYEMSHGHLSPQTRAVLSAELETLVRKQSVFIIQKLLKSFVDGSISEKDLQLATGKDHDSLKDLLVD